MANPVTTTTVAPCSRPFKTGTTTRVIDKRSVQLTVPAQYEGRTPIPVVFALHPLSVPYIAAPSIAGLDDMAKHYTFISVAPSGRVTPTPFLERDARTAQRGCAFSGPRARLARRPPLRRRNARVFARNVERRANVVGVGCQ